MAENAVIIYMSRMRDVPLLFRSISLLCLNFKYIRDYPIVVFHDDIDRPTISNLMVALHRRFGYIPNIKFELLQFEMPEWVTTDPSKYVVPMNEAWMGYRHMCRFHSGGIYKEPRLAKYDYYWRLDSDSYIYSPINYDPFEKMRSQDFEYAYMCDEEGEVPSVAQDLWETTVKFMEESNIPMNDYLKSRLVDGRWNYNMFYTNFEIAKFSFFRGKDYMAYFDYLDKSGGIYYKRWGDAPIHWLGVRLFMNPSKIWAVKDITYHHNAWVRNLSAIPNKKIPSEVMEIVEGDDYRKQRLLYGMDRFIKTNIDKLNWGE
jgi:alpha 1,2-mannosyltransferase